MSTKVLRVQSKSTDLVEAWLRCRMRPRLSFGLLLRSEFRLIRVSIEIEEAEREAIRMAWVKALLRGTGSHNF